MSSIKDFEILSTLGTGSFSSVYKVKRISDGEEYALKKVKLPNLKYKEKLNALNEIRILASINDENIIGYKQAFYDESSQCLCIIMEYASGGDVLNKITEYKKKNQRIPESTIWAYLIQTARGLKALHDIKIIHRDLKSANIFLSEDGKVAKIGDLNVSKITENMMGYTQAGTPYYASPEVWQHKPYGPKSDIWSLGCIMYELCTFLPPFRAANMTLLFGKITKGLYDPLPSFYSQDLSKVISMCLSVQPGGRPSCEKLLSHPLVMAKMTEEQVMICNKGLVFNDLIGAIKMPKNLKNLNEVLPKANYKPREVMSLNDLDFAGGADDDDLMARVNEQRPQTRIDVSGQEKPNMCSPRTNVTSPRNMVKEDCLDKILKNKDAKQTPAPAKKPYSLPSTDPLRRAYKVTPSQRPAKDILADINELKKNAPKIPGSIFSTNLPPVLKSKYSSVSKVSYGKSGSISVKNSKNVSENKENGNKNIFSGEENQQTAKPIY